MASTPTTSWTDHIFGRAKQGLGKAADESLGEIGNTFTKAGEGKRMIGFVRGASVVAGGAIALNGIVSSRDANGNPRTFMDRFGNVALGTGVMAGGLLLGGRGK